MTHISDKWIDLKTLWQKINKKIETIQASHSNAITVEIVLSLFPDENLGEDIFVVKALDCRALIEPEQRTFCQSIGLNLVRANPTYCKAISTDILHLEPLLLEQKIDKESFPNIISGEVHGKTPAEALQKMWQMIELLENDYHFDTEENFLNQYPQYVFPKYVPEDSDILKDGMCLYSIDDDIFPVALAHKDHPPKNAEEYISRFADFCQKLYSHSGVENKKNFRNNCIGELGDEIRYEMYEEDNLEEGLFWQDWMKHYAPDREAIEHWYEEHRENELKPLFRMPYNLGDLPLMISAGFNGEVL